MKKTLKTANTFMNTEFEKYREESINGKNLLALGDT